MQSGLEGYGIAAYDGAKTVMNFAIPLASVDHAQASMKRRAITFEIIVSRKLIISIAQAILEGVGAHRRLQELPKQAVFGLRIHWGFDISSSHQLVESAFYLVVCVG